MYYKPKMRVKYFANTQQQQKEVDFNRTVKNMQTRFLFMEERNEVRKKNGLCVLLEAAGKVFMFLCLKAQYHGKKSDSH